MSTSAVERRREQFTELLDAAAPRWGGRPGENTYTRFNPWLMLALALAICVGVTAVYRSGGDAGGEEMILRIRVGFAFWAVPVVLVVLPVGVRHLMRRRSLKVAAAAVPYTGRSRGLVMPAAVDGQRGLLVEDGAGLRFHPRDGPGSAFAYVTIVAACEFIPRHPLWSLPGADLRRSDGGWVEIRGLDVRPLLAACRAAGVRVLPAVNAADLRT
jgi:hypothetical protein